MNSQGANCGFERTFATVNRIDNVSRSRQIVRATRLPGVRRWEGGVLRAPQLPKAEMVHRPILRENSSKLVICSSNVSIFANSLQIV